MGAIAASAGQVAGTNSIIRAGSTALNSAIDSVGRIFGAKYTSKVEIANIDLQKEVKEQRQKTLRTIIIILGASLLAFVIVFSINKYKK